MVVQIASGRSLFSRCARLAKARGSICIAEVQREFAPGYAAAGRALDMLVDAGIVGRYAADHKRHYIGNVL